MQLGDFADDATIVISFTTHSTNGALIAPSAAFVAADFRIYKNGSATEKTSANGITVASPFDSVTGKHVVTIDTNNDTGDAGFWAAGNDYRVEINSAKTVDGHLQTGVEIGSFSIENRYSGGGLDAAGVRTAIGLATANLDTQLADLPTVAEFESRTLPSADYFVVGDYTAPANADIAAILVDTDTTIPGLIDSISGLVLSPSPTVERVLGDVDAIRFSWPVDEATITGEVSKAGGTYAAVTGVISQRADESGVYWYQLPYNAADRQLGSVRYKFTDGTYTRFVNLLVNPASAEVDLNPILDVLGTPAGDSIADDIAGISGGAGSGARTVTVTIDDGTDPLQNATVRMTEGASTYTALSNASGVAVFNLDDATYTVGASKSGYTFAGTTLVVDGTEVVTYSMTQVVVSPPDDPALSAIQVLCLDEDYVATAGVDIDFRIVTVPTGDVDKSYVGQKKTVTSDVNGVARYEAPQGAVVEYKRGTVTEWQSVTVDSDSVTNVNSFIGGTS